MATRELGELDGDDEAAKRLLPAEQPTSTGTFQHTLLVDQSEEENKVAGLAERDHC